MPYSIKQRVDSLARLIVGADVADREVLVGRQPELARDAPLAIARRPLMQATLAKVGDAAVLDEQRVVPASRASSRCQP